MQNLRRKKLSFRLKNGKFLNVQLSIGLSYRWLIHTYHERIL